MVDSSAHDKYPQIVGKLLWLSNGTCPDISQAVGVLARYMTQPSREHYNAAQKVLQYLDHTRDIHLQYGSNKQQDFLMAHSDANWASDATAQRKSSSGSMVFVCGNLVAWKSALQRCTALSAVEAEFVAATEAAREVLFFEHLFRTVGIDVGIPTIFSDNTGTIQVSKDPAQHWKLKHIDTKYHFIRECKMERSESSTLTLRITGRPLYQTNGKGCTTARATGTRTKDSAGYSGSAVSCLAAEGGS
ncbi:uncharacterized protein UHOD_11483 [Ustilago sp. UG-2017b]|nr:uncharacterized protein UHOD_11483 [Ustilago sp. UG-2017b]